MLFMKSYSKLLKIKNLTNLIIEENKYLIKSKKTNFTFIKKNMKDKKSYLYFFQTLLGL